MSTPTSPRPPRLEPTTQNEVVSAAVGGLLLGFLAVWLCNVADVVVPVVPWTLVAMLAAMSLAGWWYSRTLAARVREARGSITPEEGVRALVLGKVMMMGGSLLGGMHIAYVVDFLPRWSVPLPRERVVHGLATIAASVVFVLAGRELERACVVDRPDDDEDADGRGTGDTGDRGTVSRAAGGRDADAAGR